MNKRLSIIFLVALVDGSVLIHAENRHVSSQKTEVISTTNNQNEVVVEVPSNGTVTFDNQDYQIKINNQTSNSRTSYSVNEPKGAYRKSKHWHIRDYVARYDKEALLELCTTLWVENDDLKEVLLIHQEIHQRRASSLISALAYLTRLHPLKMLFLSAPVLASLCLLAAKAYEYCKQYVVQQKQQRKKEKAISI